MADIASRDGNFIPALLGTSLADGVSTVDIWADPSTHELLVKASVSITPSGTQDVNLIKVGGTAVALGQTTMSASLPVTIASNQASFPVTIAAGTAVIGHVITDSGSTTAVTGNVTVISGTAANLLAQVSNNGTFVVQATLAAETTKVIGTVNQGTSPWIVSGGGTAGAAASGVVTIQGVASMTPVQVSQATGTNLHTVVDSGTITTITNQVDTNLKQIGGTNTVTGGVNGTVGVGGSVATNVAIGTNPINLGVQAISAENTAVTATRLVQLVADLTGKQIVLPYANPENFVSGRATATDTTSTSLIAAPASGLRNYITQITVWNASAVSTYIKIQDGSGGTELYDIPAPAGGGATLTLPTPLRQPTTATAIFFAANASANAVFISASGYKGI